MWVLAVMARNWCVTLFIFSLYLYFAFYTEMGLEQPISRVPPALRCCGFMNFPSKQRLSYLGLFYILIPKDIFPVDCTPGTLIISC